ncbi:MAG: hypothetical protein GY856_54520 [bacterium]|nr:hypothetical protein [bacterium]
MTSPYYWPGNVRELRNVARRLAIDGRGNNPDHLLQSIEDLLVESSPMPEPALRRRMRQLGFE